MITPNENQIYNPRDLEKLLIKDWIKYIDIRKLIEFIKNSTNSPKIDTLMISNCEINNEGIFLWVDYKIVQFKQNVNKCAKIKLNVDGTLNIIKVI